MWQTEPVRPSELTFRLAIELGLGGSLKLKVSGAGKWGFFAASWKLRSGGIGGSVPEQRLRKGQWRTLVNHAEQARLWELPKSIPPPADFACLDGSTVLLSIRDQGRSHNIERANVMEPGVARIINYLVYISTLFDDQPPQAAWGYLQVVRPLPRLQEP